MNNENDYQRMLRNLENRVIEVTKKYQEMRQKKEELEQNQKEVEELRQQLNVLLKEKEELEIKLNDFKKKKIFLKNQNKIILKIILLTQKLMSVILMKK